MKQTVTHLIKHRETGLYVTNRSTEQNDTIKYSTDRRDGREFDGIDKSVIDMNAHVAVKHTHTEDDTYEKVEYD
ncbi:DUF2483 family protein [Staphylococcus simiae]|uniref:DUF2483 domain-containing protein n=1 Tax=Staphylococcus simiae CCM 7213 = CCUG 51256 TaxID=911238 RepID=G5JJV9_9STAP|nr:DUF2483 family protein [Staphylococcus simiae]EHJ07514.1 hypothetical protein SS7213T_08842 [Staphylococcus simiae CCM 7213 = CCUG 51256]PNZ09842.1 DUF2483 domain-containing protein [Staphylococcus simiae]SNV75448.1 phage protein [Staphylococcus simiae]